MYNIRIITTIIIMISLFYGLNQQLRNHSPDWVQIPSTVHCAGLPNFRTPHLSFARHTWHCIAHYIAWHFIPFHWIALRYIAYIAVHKISTDFFHHCPLKMQYIGSHPPFSDTLLFPFWDEFFYYLAACNCTVSTGTRTYTGHVVEHG